MRSLAVMLVTLLATVAEATPKWQQLEPPPPPPKADSTGFVKHDGARIYYAAYGNGNAVILLHGGMGNGDHWSHQISALAGSHRVIAIDSRGHGRSTRAKQPPSYDQMARDVIAVMDHLALDRAAIVGWSDGGEVALKLAIHHPERVAKLFVFGANYDTRGSKKRHAKSKTFAIYSAKCRADYRKLSKTPREYDKAVSWLLPIWRKPMGFTKQQLRDIRTPTLVADGEHDEIIKLEQVKEMAQLIPNARLHVFEDTSHFSLWQDPTSFNKVLVEFLAQSGAR